MRSYLVLLVLVGVLSLVGCKSGQTGSSASCPCTESMPNCTCEHCTAARNHEASPPACDCHNEGEHHEEHEHAH